MAQESYKYVIVGAGIAAGKAVEGIRNNDKDGSILMIGKEEYLPYNRPPLTKKLWFGTEQVGDIFVQNEAWYADNNIDILLGAEVISLDRKRRSVMDSDGNTWGFDRLLLATGGVPRRLEIPGGDIDNIYYYRYLDDYLSLRAEAVAGKSAVVIGGGFIGSEISAALCKNGVSVTMVFPEDFLVQRVFPENLAKAVETLFMEKGILISKGDIPTSINSLDGGRFLTRTRNGKTFESDMLIVGAGIAPDVKLAVDAGLAVGNGIVVDEHLRTSDPNIFAAGDNAFFPYLALGQSTRVEHWDNALSQGEYAGWNMTGEGQAYDHMPYFFSDLFDFGYEAVGEIDSRLESVADWEKSYERGVIYYLKDHKIRGVMTCNIYGKLDAARDLIRSGEEMVPLDRIKGLLQRESHKLSKAA